MTVHSEKYLHRKRNHPNRLNRSGEWTASKYFKSLQSGGHPQKVYCFVTSSPDSFDISIDTTQQQQKQQQR